MSTQQQPIAAPSSVVSTERAAAKDTAPVTIHVVHNDLPAGVSFSSGMAAIDTETTGLSLENDRLCLCQISDGPKPDGSTDVWLIKFPVVGSGAPIDPAVYAAPNLRAVLENPRITKLFHYARFDLAMLQRHLGLNDIGPAYCTKIASKLARPTDSKHNLRTLCRHYLGIELDKSEQLSNWAAPTLTESQQRYAASDVIYLHRLYAMLQADIAASGRTYLLDQALKYLPTRVQMDLLDLYPEDDLFAHH